jgi:hypothetical protein
MIKVSFLPKLLIFLVITLISYSSFSEGTKEAMPNSSNGTALQVKYSSGTGSYYNCPADQRIYFHIKDHNTENFYFGLNKRMRSPSTGVPTNVYYRIMNSSGQVVGPTAVPASGNGFISNYTQAIAGPKIGSYNSSGYAPITYNPSANGDYWIEIYRTSSGTTGNATGDNGEVFFIYFDFTVATTANVKKSGRVYSKAWSFITYRPSTLLPDIGYSFEGDYYGYTADSAVNKIEFGAGFQPFGFVLQMNKEGVENTGDFANDRSSKHQGLTAPQRRPLLMHTKYF